MIGGFAVSALGLTIAAWLLGSVYLLATLSPFVFRVWQEMDHPRIDHEAVTVTV